MPEPTRGGRGRPKIPEWRRRDYELRIRLDRVERAFLAQECGKLGLTLSEYVRTLINQELDRRPPVQTGEVVMQFDPDLKEDVPVSMSIPLKMALRNKVARMSVEELDSWVDEQLDFSDYEGAE